MGKWIAGLAAAVLAIFCLAPYVLLGPEIPRAALEAQYAAPPSQFVVLGDGTRLHVRDRGPKEAPVLILLHGFTGTLFVWEKWSLALSDRYRVVTLDLPGHGLTGATPARDYSQGAMAEAVLALAGQLGIAKFAVGGNSMGGGVAARLAELHPERVTAIVLVDAAGARLASRPRLHLTYYAVQIPVMNRWLLLFGIDRHWDFGRMQGTREASLAHFTLPDDTYVWDHVKAIKAPTLILWGAKDGVIPVAAAGAWHEAVPGSRLIVYPGAGHVSMLDVPGQSAADVRAFLNGLERNPKSVKRFSDKLRGETRGGGPP